MKTTLNQIRKHLPCSAGWAKLLKSLNKVNPDDECLHLRTILNSNGLDATIWCFRAVNGEDRIIRLYAVWCARQVQHLIGDERSHNAINAAEQYANGVINLGELKVAAAVANADANRYAANRYAAYADAASNASNAANRYAAYAAAASNASNRYAAYADAASNASNAANRYAAYAAAASNASNAAAQEIELRRVLDCMDLGIDPYPIEGAGC